MGYYYGKKRPERKFQGKPQFTLDDMYISPLASRRWYDEEGIAHYDPVERNLSPTGVQVMDHYLRRLSEGCDGVTDFCKIYNLRVEDLEVLIYILTGMPSHEFRVQYQLRLADELLRYTDMPLKEVARRSGFGSHTNLCVILKRELGQTPSERRIILRQPGDAGRYKV